MAILYGVDMMIYTVPNHNKSYFMSFQISVGMQYGCLGAWREVCPELYSLIGGLDEATGPKRERRGGQREDRQGESRKGDNKNNTYNNNK